MTLGHVVKTYIRSRRYIVSWNVEGNMHGGSVFYAKNPRGSPYVPFTRVCHFGRWVLDNFDIRVYFLDFALQKGPFLALKVPYTRVIFTPENACFADLKGKNIPKAYILRQFFFTFSQITWLKGEVWNPENGTPVYKNLGRAPTTSKHFNFLGGIQQCQ